MARTRSAGGGGRRSRGGGTAALVAVPRRSARLAGGNEVHGTYEESASSRSPAPAVLLGVGLLAVRARLKASGLLLLSLVLLSRRNVYHRVYLSLIRCLGSHT